jgi:hypothetical protein
MDRSVHLFTPCKTSSERQFKAERNPGMDIDSALNLMEALSRCRLTTWERGFLQGCAAEIARGKDLTPNQRSWVTTIWQRKVAKVEVLQQ